MVSLVAPLGVALMAAAPAAAAATPSATSLVPTLRLKLGVFEPSNSSTRSFAGSTLPNAEIDAQVPGGSGGTSLLSIGYTEGKRHGGDFRDIPIDLTEVNYFGNPVAGVTGNIYFGGGVAFHMMHVSGSGVSSASKTRFGLVLQAGYQTPLSIFIEAKYYFASQSVNGMNANGLAVFLGKRL